MLYIHMEFLGVSVPVCWIF